MAQVCAQELGAAFEDVIVTAGDTALVPFGMGTGGSRVMANAGPAVAQTAREVRERATRVAAELLECAAEDVRIAESRVVCRRRARSRDPARAHRAGCRAVPRHEGHR